MNNFTKEELEEIVDMMHFARKQGIENTHNISYEVELKAKSLIANYCEHDYKKYLDNSGMYYIKLCSKCGDRKSWTFFDELEEAKLKGENNE